MSPTLKIIGPWSFIIFDTRLFSNPTKAANSEKFAAIDVTDWPRKRCETGLSELRQLGRNLLEVVLLQLLS